MHTLIWVIPAFRVHKDQVQLVLHVCAATSKQQNVLVVNVWDTCHDQPGWLLPHVVPHA